MKKKIVLGVLLAVIILAAIGTYMYRHRFDKYEQSQEEQTAGIKAIGKDSRFLVTYFSWPSPDYPDLDATSGASNVVKDGHLYGNTEYVADILSKKLNADLFRIETVRSYPTQPKALLDNRGWTTSPTMMSSSLAIPCGGTTCRWPSIPFSTDMISAARPSSFSPLMAAIASAGLSRLSVKCSPRQMLFRGQPSTTEKWTRQSRRLTNG